MATPRSARRPSTGVSKVWYLTGATIVVLFALAMLVTRLPSPQAPVRVPIAVFAVLFYLAEINRRSRSVPA